MFVTIVYVNANLNFYTTLLENVHSIPFHFTALLFNGFTASLVILTCSVQCIGRRLGVHNTCMVTV